MAKLILPIAFAALLTIGCGGDSAQEEADKAEILRLEQEAQVSDSTAAVLQSIKGEIQESSENLDKLLENL